MRSLLLTNVERRSRLGTGERRLWVWEKKRSLSRSIQKSDMMLSLCLVHSAIYRQMPEITWSDYLRYRARLRGFDLSKIEEILRYSGERYYDTVTGRAIAIGKYNNLLVMIPYEDDGNSITPVTIHATTRQQIQFRLRSGRFVIDE